VRTLLLLRHAKSSWTDPQLPDHERPLAPRGVRAAQLIAAYLNEAGLAPEIVLCSSARRAQQTLELVAAAFRGSPQVLVERDLYDADPDDLMTRLQLVDQAVSSLMLIGHNPALEELARMLAGDGDSAALDQLAEKFPTAALAILTVKDWADLQWGGAYLTHVIVPRSLG
jgi:phosphohistidine phosphatase